MKVLEWPIGGTLSVVKACNCTSAYGDVRKDDLVNTKNGYADTGHSESAECASWHA